MSTSYKFIFIILFVFISRLTFLDNGYGAEPDAWRVASVARYISNTGEYVASRLPGYPVVELIYALLGTENPFILNSITALLSSFAIGMLFLISTYYEIKRPLLLAITFAFIPIVFVASTMTMDYLWAVCFMCTSWYMGLKQRPLASGIFLAIATGCRITSLVFLIPFSLMFIDRKNFKKESVRTLLSFWSSAVLGSIIIFLPVYYRYGIRFFSYSGGGYPPYLLIIKTVLLDTWGIIGTVALFWMMILLFISWRKNFRYKISQIVFSPRFMWLIAVIVVLIEYAVFPYESAYLIPMIPFLLLLITTSIHDRVFLIGSILLCSSSFFLNVDSIDRPWSVQSSSLSIPFSLKNRMLSLDVRGPIIHDYSKRISYIKFITEVVRSVEVKKIPCVVIAGNWLPYVIQLTAEGKPESEFADYVLYRKNVEYVSLLTPKMLVRYQQQNIPLFFLPSVDEYNRNVYGIDLVRVGAKEIEILMN